MIVPHEFSLENVHASASSYAQLFIVVFNKRDYFSIISTFTTKYTTHFEYLNSELYPLLRSKKELLTIWSDMIVLVLDSIHLLRSKFESIAKNPSKDDKEYVAAKMALVVAVCDAAKAIMLANKSRISKM